MSDHPGRDPLRADARPEGRAYVRTAATFGLLRSDCYVGTAATFGGWPAAVADRRPDLQVGRSVIGPNLQVGRSVVGPTFRSGAQPYEAAAPSVSRTMPAGAPRFRGRLIRATRRRDSQILPTPRVPHRRPSRGNGAWRRRRDPSGTPRSHRARTARSQGSIHRGRRGPGAQATRGRRRRECCANTSSGRGPRRGTNAGRPRCSQMLECFVGTSATWPPGHECSRDPRPARPTSTDRRAPGCRIASASSAMPWLRQPIDDLARRGRAGRAAARRETPAGPATGRSMK